MLVRLWFYRRAVQSKQRFYCLCFTCLHEYENQLITDYIFCHSSHLRLKSESNDSNLWNALTHLELLRVKTFSRTWKVASHSFSKTLKLCSVKNCTLNCHVCQKPWIHYLKTILLRTFSIRWFVQLSLCYYTSTKEKYVWT